MASGARTVNVAFVGQDKHAQFLVQRFSVILQLSVVESIMSSLRLVGCFVVFQITARTSRPVTANFVVLASIMGSYSSVSKL